MLTSKTWIITQLIDFAERLRDLREGGPSNPVEVSLMQWIWSDGDVDTFSASIEKDDDFDDAVQRFVDIDCDAGCQLAWGRLQGYATLAGYDTVIAMLREHGVDGTPIDQLLGKIESGEIRKAPEESREPAPARIYKAVKETLERTTSTRLEYGGLITIKNTTHTILDEYARQVATTIVGLLGL